MGFKTSRQSVFQTTQWTLVEDLRAPEPAQRERAIAILVERYWPPVYQSVRRMGYGPDEAAEATQGFFADVVVSRRLFEQADGKRGKLRTLVMTALRNYLADRRRRAVTRGADRVVQFSGLDRENAIAVTAGERTPEQVFERRWALVLLEEALRRAEQHFVQSGRRGHWTAFEARIVRPAACAMDPPPLADVAAEHGFADAANAAAAVQVVRRRVVALLREVIAETTADPREQDEEFALVMSLEG